MPAKHSGVLNTGRLKSTHYSSIFLGKKRGFLVVGSTNSARTGVGCSSYFLVFHAGCFVSVPKKETAKEKPTLLLM